MQQRLKFEERRPPVLDHVEQEALPNTKHGGKGSSVDEGPQSRTCSEGAARTEQ